MVTKRIISGAGFVIIFNFILLIIPSCMSQTSQNTTFDEKRARMVRNQIEARGVTDDRVLEAMLKVERHRFVPAAYLSEAYEDYPLPIGDGQTISQPYIVAFMTEALDLKESDKVLEIGTGSGYQAAVLAEICDSVFSIEIFASLSEKAARTLDELGYDNVMVRTGDGYQGWKEHAPFQAIIVTCAPTHIPEPLADQLAEGGRMIIPVGGEQQSQYLILMEKKGGKLQKSNVLPVRFVPMIDQGGRKY
jgi:protein-L-isoaspartate(D-aspartate) O-methyltransferase